ncbi:hypothetical protein HDU77_001691 [Chytriomyces hyalinus]|nr:hypothetical protein HDU77_001691 [Chytriomyces hyalinus]
MLVLPREVIQEIFAWLHPRLVCKHRRLSAWFLSILTELSFAVRNLKRFNPSFAAATTLSRTDSSAAMLRFYLFESPAPYPEAFSLIHLSRVTELDWNDDTSLMCGIPSAAGSISNLTHCCLNSNRLTGSIPLELGRLIHLRDLDLACNLLSGAIPPSLFLRMACLESLNLAMNHLSGPLPADLYSLKGLKRLNLCGNRLNGSLSNRVGNLENLQVLNVSRNQLSGKVPLSLCKLGQLEMLYLCDNSFTGGLPFEMCGMDSIRFLYVSQAGLDADVSKPEMRAFLQSLIFHHVDIGPT